MIKDGYDVERVPPHLGEDQIVGPIYVTGFLDVRPEVKVVVAHRV